MAFRAVAGQPASITVSLETSGLNVGFEVWDDSGVSPVQVTGLAGMVNNVLPAVNYSGNCYRVKIPALAPGKYFLLHIGVYTDGTYTALVNDEPQGDDTLYFEPSVGIHGITGQSIVATLQDGSLKGTVQVCGED